MNPKQFISKNITQSTEHDHKMAAAYKTDHEIKSQPQTLNMTNTSNQNGHQLGSETAETRNKRRP